MEGCALECLSTSALLPSAETGTLWEQACSGVFCVQCMQGEPRAKTACKTKNTRAPLPYFQEDKTLVSFYFSN